MTKFFFFFFFLSNVLLSKEYLLEVEGMSCAKCAENLETKLKRLSRVESAKATFEGQKATIKTKNDLILTEKNLTILLKQSKLTFKSLKEISTKGVL